jgi:hypothetical protein
MAHPFPSITYALGHLGGKNTLFVCNGVYAETVTLAAPVRLYGGLSCSGGTWRWTGAVAQVTAPAVSNPSTPVYALTVNAAGGPVTIEDMAFSSPDAVGHDPSGNGASSVAAFVNSSTVNLVRCVLAAGQGAAGADGTTLASNYSPPSPSSAPGGSPGTTSSGGAGGTITCNYKADGVTPDTSTGGTGGNEADYGTDTAGLAGSAGSAYPVATFVSTGASPPHDGAGGAYDANGDPGADGAARPGGTAATSPGKISSNGWLPTAGSPGPAGQPGQGGGGSGAAVGQCSASGVGGGAGGCGGAGGTGGGGGGASIALLTVGSTITLTACSLSAAQAGSGGRGGPGQIGQGGGPSAGPICGGAVSGAGGQGAGGSGGAGGSAGISAGIVYGPGSLPTYTTADTVITPGAAGTVGGAGSPGAGPGTPGSPGASGYLDPHASSATLEEPFSP